MSMLGPLNESKDDADLHADECCCGKYAMFYASKFIPWDFESPIIDSLISTNTKTNKNESWLWRHGLLTSRLYKRKRAIEYIRKTTLQ